MRHKGNSAGVIFGRLSPVNAADSQEKITTPGFTSGGQETVV